MRLNRARLRVAAILVLYFCAALQFTRFYAVSTIPYLNLKLYLRGDERLPFQERVLPSILLRGISAATERLHFTEHANGAFTAERGGLFLLSFGSLLIASGFTQALYSRASKHRYLEAMVFPVFLFTMMWSYVIHAEANFSYPYDFLSVAFFSAGLWCIYARHYYWLALLIVAGSFNRETTLFLIPIYALDILYRDKLAAHTRRFPYLRVLLLTALWIIIKLGLAHHFRDNSHAESYVRVRENVGRLKLRLVPALLNICGYGLPMILIFHADMQTRLRRWLWVLPLWFGVMFYAGVIVETRVYGELCPLVAVMVVLIAEDRISSRASACSVISTVER